MRIGKKCRDSMQKSKIFRNMLKQRAFAVFLIFSRRIFFGVMQMVFTLKHTASVVDLNKPTTSSLQN